MIHIYSGLTDIPIDQIVHENKDKGNAEFKAIVTDAIVHHLSPIRCRILELQKESHQVELILEGCEAKARIKAQETMVHVWKAMGFA